MKNVNKVAGEVGFAPLTEQEINEMVKQLEEIK